VSSLYELNAILSNIIALILDKAKKLEVELATNERKKKTNRTENGN